MSKSQGPNPKPHSPGQAPRPSGIPQPSLGARILSSIGHWSLVIGHWTLDIGHWSFLIPYLALAILLLPAIQPLLTTDFTCGYDNGFHLWRAVQIARCLRQGILYPRWAPDMAHGYGVPLFIFHPPLTAYAAALLNLLGLSWPLAINATFALGMLLAGLFTFIFVRDLFGPAAGLVAAVAYVFAPFQAYDVFNRGSLSESFAWVFPPLLLWALHRWSARGEYRFLPVAALGLAGFILTHNLFAFLFAPLLAGWVILEGWLARDWRAIGRGALAGALGLSLCTFFWLPGLAERGWVQTDRLLGTWVFDYRNNFLDLRQLLALPRATDPALLNDWPPKALGLLPALVALLPLARWRRLTRQARWRVALLLGSTVVFASLTLPFSRPVWDHVPLLSYVQFPWRFLGPAAFCAAILAGAFVARDQPPASNLQSPISSSQLLPTAVIISLLVLGNLGWFYPCHSAPPRDTSIAGMLAWERATDTLGTTAKGEYLPIWVQRMPQATELEAAYASESTVVRLRPESLPRGARVIDAEYGPVDATILVESPVPFEAHYLAFYYPGWSVTLDGEPVPIAPSDPEGLISFTVPAGEHTVRVRFGETPLRLGADAISILSLAALLVLTLHHVRSSKYEVRRPESEVQGPAFEAWRHEAEVRRFESDMSGEKAVSGFSSLFLVGLAILLGAFKLAAVDRLETSLRRTNLVDGHLSGVDVPTEITFGDEFVLLGHDALPDSAMSGDWFEIKTYWRALQPGGPNYGVTFHLVDSEGYHWEGSDTRSPRWHRTPPPVREWLPDKYAIVALSIPVLPGIPPGTYTVQAVAFDRSTLAPLTAHSGDGVALGPALPLGQITVKPPRQPADADELGIGRRLDESLGSVTLLGADFDRDEVAPGDSVLLTTFWQADEQPSTDLTAHLTLMGPDGSPAAEYDLPPTVRWHPTSAWRSGDIWRGQHTLYLPAHLVTGDYTWQLSIQPSHLSTNLPSILHVTAPDRTFTPPPVDVEIGTRLGNVATLVGANLEPESSNLNPGDTFTVTLIWQAEDTPTASYHVFLHLLGPDGAMVSQSDGIPAYWTRPTTGWLPGEYVADVHVLTLPTDISSGDYTLSTGLYIPGNERLTAPDGSNAIQVTTVSTRKQEPPQ